MWTVFKRVLLHSRVYKRAKYQLAEGILLHKIYIEFMRTCVNSSIIRFVFAYSVHVFFVRIAWINMYLLFCYENI